MTDEIAGFAAGLRERSATRSCPHSGKSRGGVRYGYMTTNPAKSAGANPMPAPRAVRVFTPEELDAIAEELDTLGSGCGEVRCRTGLRPAEWAKLERRDVDRARRVMLGTRHQDGTLSPRGSADGCGARGARLAGSTAARQPVRLTRKVPKGGPFDVHNFRRREWGPAIESAGIARPARLYDMRSTFISNALARGLTVFETARIAGTSVAMIESDYGALVDTAHESLLERLEAARMTP